MDKQTPWIDTHIHVSEHGPGGEKREHLVQDLLEVQDRCDADLRLVISTDGVDTSLVTRSPEGVIANARLIHSLIREAPTRLYGSATVNPHFLDESLHSMERCFGEWGFVQLGEMLQYSMDYEMNSDPVERLVRAAVEYDVPVQVHLGTYWHPSNDRSCRGHDQLVDLLGLVERVPEAKYVLAHAIGCGTSPEFVSWADWFLDVIGGLFPTYPDNFWIEIRDFQCPALKRTLAQVPTNRLLAGTDWTTRIGPPFQSYGTMFGVTEAENPFPPGAGAMEGYLRQAGATDEDVARVAYKNARELYRLPSD